jgi:hypothetical protein
MTRTLIITILIASLSLFAEFSFSADQEGQIYGSQLMTQQERNEYRAQMQDSKTDGERELIRNKHHNKMKVRAKKKGITLSDQWPAKGDRMGQGGGQGGGKGQ